MESEQLSHREEKEIEPAAKIELHFFRHSIREKDPNKPNNDQLLTPEGRQLAKQKSSPDTNIEQSLAWGSPRPRAQETAGLIMAGAEADITGQETLAELKNKLDQSLKLGSKIGIDERLNFNDDVTTPYGKEFNEAFKKGKFLRFLVEKSDQLGKELNDPEAGTYSRMAGQIAEIIKKYLAIAPQWEKLVRDESKNYSNKLERFLGSHQGVLESFLAKVIELTKGAAVRDEFVVAVNSQGFDFVEGLNVEIKNNDQSEPEVHITFQKEKNGKIIFNYDEIVPVAVVDKIVADVKK